MFLFVFIGGFALIRGTVREIVETEVKKLDTEMRGVRKAAVLAEDSTTKARKATKEAQNQANIYAKTLDELNERAKKVDQEFVVIQQKLQAETGNLRASAQKGVEDLGDRLDRMGTLVAMLAKRSDVTREMLANYQKSAKTMKAERSLSKKQFLENGQYSVMVQFNTAVRKLAGKVVAKLNEAGFKVATVEFAATSPSNINMIQYSKKAKRKAEEVNDIIGSLVEIKEMKQKKRVMLEKTNLPNQFIGLSGKETIKIMLATKT